MGGVRSGRPAGYSGPHQQQGWRVYQFTDWRGVMAVWWDNDAGAVFADTAPDPVDLTGSR